MRAKLDFLKFLNQSQRQTKLELVKTIWINQSLRAFAYVNYVL